MCSRATGRKGEEANKSHDSLLGGSQRGQRGKQNLKREDWQEPSVKKIQDSRDLRRGVATKAGRTGGQCTHTAQAPEEHTRGNTPAKARDEG